MLRADYVIDRTGIFPLGGRAMSTRVDSVNIIGITFNALSVGTVIWAIFWKSREAIKHLNKPALAKTDIAHIRMLAMLAIALAIPLGNYIFLVLRELLKNS
jgi:hypothetical protein